MKAAFRLLRVVFGALIAGVRRHGGADAGALRTMRPIGDWQQGPDGAPRMLGPHERITVTRVGIFAGRDPARVNDGWRDAPVMLARTIWCIVIAAATAVGWFRGLGPLKNLQEYRRRRQSDQAAG